MVGPPAAAWVINPSRVYRYVAGSAILFGATIACLYAYMQPWGLSSLLILVAFCASTLAAVLALQRAPTGTLRWDGASWLWADGNAGAVNHLDCALDFQRWMLLRVCLDTGKQVWLWAESDGGHLRWRAFRRAVAFCSGGVKESPRSVTGA